MKTIAVLGALDTKGDEHSFVAERIRSMGAKALLIDVGTGGPPTVTPDVERECVASAIDLDLAPLMARRDRGECVAAMGQAAAVYLERLQKNGVIHGVVSLGGSGGASIAATAMRLLPVGFPKLIVSTLAAGDTRGYVGAKDITMMPSVLDIAGLNHISKKILANAAGAMVGMADQSIEEAHDRPIIVASMFGNTTELVTRAKELLEARGYEVLVFHATGVGGAAMESMIESGLVAGVLDVTTTELADELVGGILTAGPNRLAAAGAAGIPAVVAPGCLDMVNFGAPSTIPTKFSNRRFYEHNPQVTLMRTSAEEAALLGQEIARKLNRYKGPVSTLFPNKGLSVIGTGDGPFSDRDADAALANAWQNGLEPRIAFKALGCSINAPEFADAAVEELLRLMQDASNA